MIIVVLLLILSISIGFYIYIRVTYNKYKKIKTKNDLSGFEVSRKIIDNYDLNNIYITESKMQLISRYDSNRKVIRLTNKIFNDNSIVSCAISSIEASHAILDKKNDQMFHIKEKINPVANILLVLGYIITIIGCFFGHVNTIVLGLSLIDLLLLYNVIFYKVEKKSIAISMVELIDNKIITKSEIKKIEELLKVSSFTSFASIIFPVVELIKKILIFGDSNK